MQYALAAWLASELKESLDRWRTIHGNNRLNSYHNLMWTRRLGYDLYNAYPIYDWTYRRYMDSIRPFQMAIQPNVRALL